MLRSLFLENFKVMVMIVLLMMISSPSYGFQIEIKDNKLSAKAEQVPMHDLLKLIAIEYNVTVRMDPTINPRISVSFKNKKLDMGLKSLLQPQNHVLIWKPNPDRRSNPSAPAYLLAQIHVFKPGKKDRMIDIKDPTKKIQPKAEFLETTEVTIEDNKVFVPVILGYQDAEIETTLLFDTGSSSIVLYQNVADQLGIEEFQVSQGTGVGGVKIETKATELSYVKVGPNKKENLRADIIEYDGPADENTNGLLGMNFLRGLKYVIDFDNETIHWTP